MENKQVKNLKIGNNTVKVVVSKTIKVSRADEDMDKRVNKLLSGLESIVQSIAEMRNNGSDSHGLGNKRVNISDYHARLAVNSSTTMAEFILSVSQHSK